MIQQQYVVGNAIDVKAIVTKHKVQPNLVVSSPPYFDLLNYNNNEAQIGYGHKSYDDYLNVITQVFQDCYDVTTPNATFWLVVDTFKKHKEVKLFPFDIVNKLKERGKASWVLKEIIIWDKGKNLPWNANGRFKNQHEYILFFTKGDEFKFRVDRVREILDLKKWWKTYPERYNPDGKAPSNIWNFTTPIRGWGDSKQNHFCPLPFPLIEKIISLCSDEQDWVLDPFTGSGSVLAISQQMNRHSIGIDVNSDYKVLFKQEVLDGAERYWLKRSKELDDNIGLLKNFKDTNKKLRKLKVASHICNHLTQINNQPFLYYTKDKPKNKLEIFVLQNGKVPQIDLCKEDLTDLIKQSKVDATVIIQNDKEFQAKLNGAVLYKYKLDKFFSYQHSYKRKKNHGELEKKGFMYSNIAVKIPES